jgi:hypothetical protein
MPFPTSRQPLETVFDAGLTSIYPLFCYHAAIRTDEPILIHQEDGVSDSSVFHLV